MQKVSFFTSKKIQKYRKCPALAFDIVGIFFHEGGKTWRDGRKMSGLKKLTGLRRRDCRGRRDQEGGIGIVFFSGSFFFRDCGISPHRRPYVLKCSER